MLLDLKARRDYAELVIGIVGAVGSKLGYVQQALKEAFDDAGYTAEAIHLIIGAALQEYGLLTPGMSADDEGHTYLNLLLTDCENATYAIAAYDAGPTAVNRAGGIPNSEARNEVKGVDNCLEKQLHMPRGLETLGLACGCQ